MPKQRYLLQKDQDYVYIWTEALSEKKGFVEITEVVAKEMMGKSLRGRVKTEYLDERDMKDVTKERIELRDELLSSDDEEILPPLVDDGNFDALSAEFNRIESMTSKNQLEKYCFKLGIELDRRETLSNMKETVKQAVKKIEV